MMRKSVFFALLLASVSAFATARAGKMKADSVAEFNENPWIYLYGEITRGQIYRADHLDFTQISFQPAYTVLEETVMFCGNQTQAFNGKLGPIVVTYSRRATGDMYRGVACHELENVSDVPSHAPVK